MDEKDFLQKLHAWNTEVILCCGNLILKPKLAHMEVIKAHILRLVKKDNKVP